MTGKFVTEWTNALTASGKDIKEVDVGVGVSALLAVKDTEELVSCLRVSPQRSIGADPPFAPSTAQRLACLAHDSEAHVALLGRHVDRH